MYDSRMHITQRIIEASTHRKDLLPSVHSCPNVIVYLIRQRYVYLKQASLSWVILYEFRFLTVCVVFINYVEIFNW
jgi:hypothetical protein